MAISFNNGSNPTDVKFNGQDVTAINFNGTQVWTKPSSDWQTVWTGSQTFNTSGRFTVPGLGTVGNVQVTATAVFNRYAVDSDYSEFLDTITDGINRQTLPKTIYGYMASVDLSRSGGDIVFTFHEYLEYSKYFDILEIPASITITEVRRQS